jgi:hypothetical protein
VPYREALPTKISKVHLETGGGERGAAEDGRRAPEEYMKEGRRGEGEENASTPPHSTLAACTDPPVIDEA